MSDNLQAIKKWAFPVGIAVVFAGAFFWSGTVYQERHSPVHTVLSSAWGTSCEPIERPYIRDAGNVPTSAGSSHQVSGTPIKFSLPDNYIAVGTSSPEFPLPMTVHSYSSGMTPDADNKRVDVIDIAAIDNTTYAMTGLPRSASNMAVAQALARQFVDSQGAIEAECKPAYWTGPNLPGDIETLHITTKDNGEINAVIAVVGDQRARALIFTQASADKAVEEGAVQAIGRAMTNPQQ
ncbi:hypothetical protein [Mycobacteroides abscessus]|uniref:hypothetical protein n=1 Tax=Mycobacteroides abscessus TaxID=36809 RepID=UPI000C2698F0|nr:hypothetical protein [Mycobacteroides abscessus]RIR12837.1 hypothetical protein D2E27_16205 [Mycobacteroides abscessus]RIR65829.1 hypothetical protein D2E62_14430 [Mycobacteroides abscessus]RIS08572.1 hypothetical protein D2E58_01560 [Mycobacteroides abscessus]